MSFFPETSATLMGELRGGDGEAWISFVSLYGPRIVNACQALNVNRTTAEDIAQDILLKLVTNLAGYDPEKGGFTKWLNTVIRNEIRTHARSAAVRLVQQAPAIACGDWFDELADSVTSVIFSDERVLLHAAIDQARATARPKEWEVFRRRHIPDTASGKVKTVKEVAAELGLTVALVKVIDHRFLNRLRVLLPQLKGLIN
jgi:RNA polymerase sigma factor (sigma-70 family)